MKIKLLFPYCLLSAVLLSLGWYEWGSGLFLLIAFIPLLLVEDKIYQHKQEIPSFKIWLLSGLTFFLWNLFTTWWVKNASLAGAITAILLNTLLMSITFWLFHITKRKLGTAAGNFALVFYWIGFEYFYMHGEITWPWLTLGHGFMFTTKLIQWYDITGVFGGSLWILVVNLAIFQWIKGYRHKPRKEQFMRLAFVTLLILIPIGISLTKYYTYTENPDPKNIVVIQPNIDPYLKFNDIPSITQTMIQLDEARKMGDSLTDYYVAPETSISNGIWLDRLKYVPDIRRVKSFIQNNPQAEYIVGIMCYKRYLPGEKLSSTARYAEGADFYYDSYNSAIQIDTSDYIPIYHKSQLVTGVEKMPYRKYLRFLEKIMLHLGGTFRSHGIQKNRDVFISVKDSTKIAPVICWESVFGEYVTDYIKLGAEYIFVITNDGWWGDTPGHRQHNALSCIRAIETRRSIARSANTGISSFINQRGDVLQTLTWWKRGALKDTLNANSYITFYVKHGDYIGRICLMFGLLLGLYTLVIHLKSKSLKL